ncbi:hypothetical protein [Kitasatospora sp. NPDC097643]|uniref:hypothetical protein n=1 Tax=Kitasatospora sp. NPDC097643 TaxID=3157230 RepID=UPI00331AD492
MRMRPTTAESAGQHRASEQHAHELRAELDELLRASRYAGQRERRLNEAIRATPGRQQPDGELLRQLSQARTLREGLGARCLQLSEQLQVLEQYLRQPTPRSQQQPQPQPAATAPEPEGVFSPDLGALAERVSALHRGGAFPEAAELLTQAAIRLQPRDAAQLAAVLIRSGPAGSSLQLARNAARTTPERAVAVLAELRELGLAEEAAELFHAFWGYPATALPTLLAALERAGQVADGATLLWEWGSAPTPELTTLAAGLHHAGRHQDVRTLLRQAAGRPTADLAALATDLPAPLPAVLLHELAALRPPVELVRLAAALDGHPELYGHLLEALHADEARHRTTLATLRTEGLPTTPTAPKSSRWGRR